MAIRNAFPAEDLRAEFGLDELCAEYDELHSTTTLIAGRHGCRARATRTRAEIVTMPDMAAGIRAIVGDLAKELDIAALSVDDLIARGELPPTLRGGDTARYRGRSSHPPTWPGWCEAWRGIAWVRYQAFERDAEAEDAAREAAGDPPS